MFAEELMTTIPVERPTFCLFTGSYPDRSTGLPVTWQDIIEKEVLEDIQRRKKTDAPVVFRPVSEIDAEIDRFKHERFEKSRALAAQRL